MNYGVIVAGGSGSRVKSIDVPKQYYEIDGVAILLYSLRKMLSINMFDKIYIVVSEDYIDYNREIIGNVLGNEILDKIRFVPSGRERIDSVHNALVAIEENEDIKDDDIVVIHDAARPFVSSRILIDNINGAREYGAVVTVEPAADTMLILNDLGEVVEVPNRNKVYKEQTPTSSNLKLIIELYNKLTEEDRSRITGTAQIFTENNYKIKTVHGSDSNFKITTDEDLERAKQKMMININGK